MAKDKGKGEETKPSSETKDAARAQDGAVKTKEAEAKDVPAFQPSKKILLLQPRPKASVDRIRFLVRQSLCSNLYHVCTNVKTIQG